MDLYLYCNLDGTYKTVGDSSLDSTFELCADSNRCFVIQRDDAVARIGKVFPQSGSMASSVCRQVASFTNWEDDFMWTAFYSETELLSAVRKGCTDFKRIELGMRKPLLKDTQELVLPLSAWVLQNFSDSEPIPDIVLPTTSIDELSHDMRWLFSELSEVLPDCIMRWVTFATGNRRVKKNPSDGILCFYTADANPGSALSVSEAKEKMREIPTKFVDMIAFWKKNPVLVKTYGRDTASMSAWGQLREIMSWRDLPPSQINYQKLVGLYLNRSGKIWRLAIDETINKKSLLPGLQDYLRGQLETEITGADAVKDFVQQLLPMFTDPEAKRTMSSQAFQILGDKYQKNLVAVTTEEYSACRALSNLSGDRQLHITLQIAESKLRSRYLSQFDGISPLSYDVFRSFIEEVDRITHGGAAEFKRSVIGECFVRFAEKAGPEAFTSFWEVRESLEMKMCSDHAKQGRSILLDRKYAQLFKTIEDQLRRSPDADPHQIFIGIWKEHLKPLSEPQWLYTKTRNLLEQVHTAKGNDSRLYLTFCAHRTEIESCIGSAHRYSIEQNLAHAYISAVYQQCLHEPSLEAVIDYALKAYESCEGEFVCRKVEIGRILDAARKGRTINYDDYGPVYDKLKNILKASEIIPDDAWRRCKNHKQDELTERYKKISDNKTNPRNVKTHAVAICKRLDACILPAHREEMLRFSNQKRSECLEYMREGPARELVERIPCNMDELDRRSEADFDEVDLGTTNRNSDSGIWLKLSYILAGFILVIAVSAAVFFFLQYKEEKDNRELLQEAYEDYCDGKTDAMAKITTLVEAGYVPAKHVRQLIWQIEGLKEEQETQPTTAATESLPQVSEDPTDVDPSLQAADLWKEGSYVQAAAMFRDYLRTGMLDLTLTAEKTNDPTLSYICCSALKSLEANEISVEPLTNVLLYIYQPTEEISTEDFDFTKPLIYFSVGDGEKVILCAFNNITKEYSFMADTLENGDLITAVETSGEKFDLLSASTLLEQKEQCYPVPDNTQE